MKILTKDILAVTLKIEWAHLKLKIEQVFLRVNCIDVYNLSPNQINLIIQKNNKQIIQFF